jgi:hypothetical protein
MYKIISIFLLVHVFTVSAHRYFPLTFITNTDVLMNTTATKINYTLPNTVIPKNYKLQITPYLEDASDRKFTFDGIVEIKMDVIESIQNIVLHSKDLVFDRNSINLKTEKADIQEFSIKFDSNKDFVNLTSLKGEFEKGSYVLKIKYGGTLGDDMRGFYRSSYVNAEGVKK